MDSLIMFRTRLVSAALAAVISSSLGLAPPAGATEGDAAERGAASHTRPAASDTALRYFTTAMVTT